MNIEDQIKDWIREIVREEVIILNGQLRRLTSEELAERWHTDTGSINRLVIGGHLRAIQLSERKRVFAIEEVVRFENDGGISQLANAA